MRDAFGVEHPEVVSKDFRTAAAWTTKAGKSVSLKAKEAPVRAILRGDELARTAAPRTARRADRAKARVKQAAGVALREIGYRPDYAAAAFTQLPKLAGRAA